ncbi:serine/threonine protein kinase [Desertifilum sp. FACHB-1129]|uniref:Protein kinase domain-containing protein n=2 Tax=Desertifilum tharense IPPAS B-1220 TaxID=1781255 RepID=A0A1E5QEC8_9CYAN|nr:MULTISPECIES: serine/threonine-protein kinase [unclassified Desertifilum]MDA0211437.1 serine/threonine protein kinase [Cyanobacteria bacterium FC1]OEJ72944.1 hypothetical protein BH720_22435 [Desertifilum tharense IPPAS B-1220]MBD2313516.1 serine/threonine protein kinase [Desertifilum sp. FACHB-1129]MBD2323848.1 serine/threonine protein kinase [Desertifilum sp. FACHB-866]MBD2333693.1 serine/threonine protein kinase [Desertifilum sp. FACHB-868]
MLCCINPECPNPVNPEVNAVCQACGTPMGLLRGHYRVKQLLSNQGGFGRTYLAEDIDKLSELCVIKQLAPKVQGTWALQKAKELFELEARQLQQLGEHPQIPTLYAYFEEQGQLYLVQQFIPGQTLDKVQTQAWSDRQIYDLLVSLLPVLQFIHARQVIHRDLKPANIMRRSATEAQYLLIDFGASKQLAFTTGGTQIGTLGYAPLEQMQQGEAYPASDLYSLGVTCFRLLTQVDPHHLFLDQGYEWVKTWKTHLRQPIGSEIVQVLDRLLQKERDRRYASAEAVLKDLSSPPLTPVVSTLGVTQRLPTAKPRRFPIWIASTLLVLSIVGGYSISRRSIPTLSEGNLSLATTIDRYLTGTIIALAIAPDGQTLVSATQDKTIKIWDWQAQQLKANLVDDVLAIALTPDGQTLASGNTYRTVKLWDLRTGQPKRTLTGHQGNVFAVTFSPDGQTLASGSSDQTIKIWDIATGQLKNTLSGHTGWVRTLAITPDGQTLVSGSEDSTIKLWDMATGQLKNTLMGHQGAIRALAIAPDGETLLSGSSDNTIRIWHLPTEQLQDILTAHANYVLALAITTDGQTLVSGSSDGTIKLWNLPTRQMRDTLAEHRGSVWALAISPDRKTLVSGGEDRTIRIWRGR